MKKYSNILFNIIFMVCVTDILISIFPNSLIIKIINACLIILLAILFLKNIYTNNKYEKRIINSGFITNKILNDEYYNITGIASLNYGEKVISNIIFLKDKLLCKNDKFGIEIIYNDIDVINIEELPNFKIKNNREKTIKIMKILIVNNRVITLFDVPDNIITEIKSLIKK